MGRDICFICWLSSRIFFRGTKSIDMQISIVMLIFLTFLDQISGGQKSRAVGGGKLLKGGASCGRKPACGGDLSQPLLKIDAQRFWI